PYELEMTMHASGWAFLQDGRPDAAHTEFESARADAAARGDAFQVARALEGLVALGRLADEDVTALETEMLEIHDRLGIIATPTFPTTPVSQT
ncbi:MAG: hypothetical protein ABI720_12625, partial [Actinomycetes bacterium]